MRKYLSILLVLLAVVSLSFGQTFTDIATDNQTYGGKQGYDKARAIIDANFAQVEAGADRNIGALTINDTMTAISTNDASTNVIVDVNGRLVMDDVTSLADNTFVVGDASNQGQSVTLSGDVLSANDGAMTIQDVSVAADDIAVANGKIIVGDAGGTGTAVTVSADFTISNTGVGAIAAGVIVNADISATALIAASKLEAVAPGSILVGNAATSLTEVAVSGDVTIATNGAVTIANNAVNAAKTANGVFGGSADLFIDYGTITSSAIALQTNAFNVTFGSAPVVTCTYTEDPGDVRPLNVVTVTATNFIVNVTADMNFGWTAIGPQ